jgi:hydroxymethylpyrimidine pyrophosphatase-like HAD family hydrolase
MTQRIVCIDLDGTIAHYDEWKGETHFGKPIDGVVEALTKLKENNCLLIIYTTRADKTLIKLFLDTNNIPFDFINENPNQPTNAIGGKPFADVYIDDKAIQFMGDWSKTTDEALNFKTWDKMISVDNDRIALAKEFLIHDFDQSYQQLRHYDAMSWDITKFSFIELLVGITATWAIYVFAKTPENANSFLSQNYLKLIPTILSVCYIFSLLASFLIARNRVYYAKVARYINEHRKFSLDIKPLGFLNSSEFYTTLDFPPAFDKWSTHLVSLYVLQLISAIILGCILFCLCLLYIENDFLKYFIASMSGLASFVINIWTNIAYMKKQDNKFGRILAGNN